MMAILVEYELGNSIDLRGTFKDSVGTVIDPPVANVKYEEVAPDGTKVSLTFAAAEFAKISVGIYSRILLLNQVGTWHYRFYSDESGVEVADEHALICKETVFD